MAKKKAPAKKAQPPRKSPPSRPATTVAEPASAPAPGPRGSLRELRRHRVHEIFAEILAEAGRHEREAARALAEMAEAGAQVGFDGRGLAPGRRIGREVSARQERVLSTARLLEPYEARLRGAPDDLAAAGEAAGPALAALRDARSIAEDALARLAEGAQCATAAAAASMRSQTAAVNLALAASRSGEDHRSWIDHAERIRSLAGSAADEAQGVATRFASMEGAIRDGLGKAAETAAGLEDLAGRIATEGARALETSDSAATLRSRLARIRDDGVLQGLLVHELEQIEEEARLDEERGRELIKASRASLRPRTAEQVARALGRLEREIGMASDGVLPPVDDLRAGIESIRVAAADHEQQIGRLAHVQADLLALRRRQAAILSAFPASTETLAGGLVDLAALAEGARTELVAIAGHVGEMEERATDLAGRAARVAGELRQRAVELLETPARAGVFGRASLHADLLVAVARLAAGHRGAAIQSSLDALEEGSREAAAAGGRLGGTWQAAEADLRRGANLLEEAASGARLLARRLGRVREDLGRAQGHLVALVVAAGELRATLDAAPGWKEETLHAIEEVASRADVSRRAAEEAGRSGSRLRLTLRALEASADELDHLSGLL